MRIGIFTDSYRPIISGVTVSIDVLEKELRKLGHEVYVIAYEHPNAKEKEFVLRQPGHKLPMTGLEEFRIGKMNRKQVKEIGAYNFDVIHCHTEFTMGRLGRKVAQKYNIPLVHTYHTMYEEYVHYVTKTFASTLRFLSKRYFTSFASSANGVIFPTKKVEKYFIENGYKKDSRIIPTGIYLERFRKINYKQSDIDELRQSLGLSKDDFVMLFLGRISREKSISELIDYFAKIDKENVKLLIVGGGPDLLEFKEQVKRLNLQDKVIFTGMVKPIEVPIYYHMADLFVNFSMTETQGLTYIEALAGNCPLLVKYDTNLDGIIENGSNGFAFKSSEEFYRRFYQIYNNPILLNEMTIKAPRFAEKFSAQSYAKNVLELYRSLL